MELFRTSFKSTGRIKDCSVASFLPMCESLCQAKRVHHSCGQVTGHTWLVLNSGNLSAGLAFGKPLSKA